MINENKFVQGFFFGLVRRKYEGYKFTQWPEKKIACAKLTQQQH